MTTQYIETYNAGYTTDSGSKLFFGAWRKTSGGTDTVVGTYQFNFSIRTIIPGYFDTTTTTTGTLTYNADHTWSSSITTETTGQPSQTQTDSGTWSDSDPITFVSFNGNYYLHQDDGYYTRE
jgi:hypothetical protein